MYAKWSPDKAAGVQALLDDEGQTLWADVLADWRNTEKHDAFAKYCSVANMLGAAGRHYRETLDAMPGDALALAMQNRIVAMATVQLPVHAVQLQEPVTRSKWFWGIMVLFAVGGLLGGLIFGR